MSRPTPTFPYIIVMALLGALLALPQSALAQNSVTFTTDTTISSANTTYEGYDVTVSGCTVTVDGSHSFNSLMVTSGGVVTHTAGSTGGLNLSIATNVTIQQGGFISANGRGYAQNTGPGAGGNDKTGGYGGGGGGYGGMGPNGAGGAAGIGGYGNIKQPSSLGSGGGLGLAGARNGGAGGGAIRLIVTGTLRVDGTLSANGAQGDWEYGGGGSGGSIWLNAGTVAGTGALTAFGGDQYQAWYTGAGGGGGRIAIYYTSLSFTGQLTVRGGQGRNTFAGAGTIFKQAPGGGEGDLLVQADGRQGWSTPLVGPQTYDNIVVRDYGYVNSHGMTVLDLTVVSNLTIEQAGFIDASGNGYAAGQGPGRGLNDTTGGYGGGGGGFAGNGTSGAGGGGGDFYGPVKITRDGPPEERFGSGGGSGQLVARSGGAGGGAINLTVLGTLKVDGFLRANGAQGDWEYGGGGSGGSIWLNVGTLAGSGVISTHGADQYQAWYTGGGGSGGRISLQYSVNTYTGLIAAHGGQGRGTYAGAGTILMMGPSQAQGDVLVNNDGRNGGHTIFVGQQIFDNVRVWGFGKISPPVLSQLQLQVLGDLNVELGGYVSVGGRGFPEMQGQGAGQNERPGTSSGAGGGHGGAGGGAYSGSGALGGLPYGSETLPVTFGSGGGRGNGGNSWGGGGGGAMHLIVNGALRLNGTLDANGAQGEWEYGGGGSGGSILIRAGQIDGNGLITAVGGTQYPAWYAAGGGGGGRVAYYYALDTFTGTVRVNGGGGSLAGGDGSLYREKVAGSFSPTLTVSATTLAGGQTAIATVQINAPAPAGGLSVALSSGNSALISVPTTVAIAEGEVLAAFPITAQSTSVAKTVTIQARLWDKTSSDTITVKPWLAGLKLSPTSVNGGTASTGTITLNVAAPSSGLSVMLSSSDGSATTAASVIVPAGTKTVDFNIATSAVSAIKSALITTTHLAEAKSATLYVNPGALQVKTHTTTPASVVGGGKATAVVTLTGPAPAGGMQVALSSADPTVATVPAFVKVLAGKTSASYSVVSKVQPSTKSVILSATLGVTKMTTLTVRLTGIQSLQLIPGSVVGGETSIGIITLDSVPTSPVTVTITSSKTQAIPDTFVVIPAGETFGAFYIDTTSVTANVLATIMVKANGTQKTQVLTITP